MSAFELIGILALGLVFFLLEEFQYAFTYTLLTLAVSVLSGLALSRFVFHKRRPLFSWCILGACTAGLASILRPALVYGGYVSYLRGVDCFGRVGLDSLSYVLFVLSGAVAGSLVARHDPRGWHRALPLLGVAFGVLYSYKLAHGFWWSPLTINGALL
ncbi:MAG: hypothetical protein ACYSUQ_14160, partial [Planctomycetota bacterium]